MKHWTTLFLFTLLLTPLATNAQMLLSEIAWMGTDTDDAHEWIELYNFSASSTDLAGWTLTSADGNLDVALSGVMGPHGVVLLERGTDDVVPGIEALFVYSGEMVDAGTTITLKDPEGNVADVANGGDNWEGIGGYSGDPKMTAQRNRFGGWVTAAPTPGLENAQEDDPLPEDDADTTTPTTTEPTTETDSGSSGGGSSSRSNNTEPILTISAPATTYAGKSVTLATSISDMRKFLSSSLEYVWNFGDMEVGSGETVEHHFAFPGEYVVVAIASSTKGKLVARHDVGVLPSPLSLSLTDAGDVVVQNENNKELVLDGYTLSGGSYEFVFPEYSYLKPGASIVLAREKVADAEMIAIRDTEGFEVATLKVASPTMVRNEEGEEAGAAIVAAIPSAPPQLPSYRAPVASNGTFKFASSATKASAFKFATAQ